MHHATMLSAHWCESKIYHGNIDEKWGRRISEGLHVLFLFFLWRMSCGLIQMLRLFVCIKYMHTTYIYIKHICKFDIDILLLFLYFRWMCEVSLRVCAYQIPNHYHHHGTTVISDDNKKIHQRWDHRSWYCSPQSGCRLCSLVIFSVTVMIGERCEMSDKPMALCLVLLLSVARTAWTDVLSTTGEWYLLYT